MIFGFLIHDPVMLLGGSAFSPASIITTRRAQTQAAFLAEDVGCPSSTSEEIVACLRQLSARVLNDAQTKLLAISGPFQYWGPVLDGIYLQEPLSKALQRPKLRKIDLLIGSAQQDGLISRAKAIKGLPAFEEVDSSTQFSIVGKLSIPLTPMSKSLMKMLKSTEAKMESCGTPLVSGHHPDLHTIPYKSLCLICEPVAD
ncbi:hypothetical protein WISP_64925 [Willisornis vidua]|uniref:Carboxylesterase type B domain-containing protein n=1 Tax=Willisornis vidua TaxID=1566151 RepID=A0ABQ9DAL9_9PASS|nr:hypothetical protein WISP_64925 [Willisornis vidua]